MKCTEEIKVALMVLAYYGIAVMVYVGIVAVLVALYFCFGGCK